MELPRPGARFLDTTTYRIVRFVGDHGHGPYWEREDDGSSFYCDWEAYFLWDRFKPLEGPPDTR